MNLDELLIIQHEDMKCEETSIATMASYWKIDYEMMFRDRLYFDFLPSNENLCLLGNRLNVNLDKNVYELLEKNHGIVITPSDKTEDFILNELKNNHPVMTFYDQFYAPWLKEKDKVDNERYRGFLLLLEYKEVEKRFICVDIHKTKQLQSINYDNVIHGCDRSRNKSISHRKVNMGDISYKEIIKESIDLLYTPKTIAKNSFDAIRLFADDVLDMDLKDEFYGYENIFYSPLSEALRNICQNTKLYLLFLEFLKRYDTDNIIDQFYQDIYDLNVKWKSVTALILKNFYKGTFDLNCKNNVRRNIMQIADFEENVINSMKERL